MNIRLQIMTKELCRIYMEKFEVDPALFSDQSAYRPYRYDQSACDAYFARQQDLGRVHFAIILSDDPIGEIILKNIDQEMKHCTLGISLQCDQYKNRGYGTMAEIMALEYAFVEMEMETVYADALLGNDRSRHVLEKVGFTETHKDDAFAYYVCHKHSWKYLERG